MAHTNRHFAKQQWIAEKKSRLSSRLCTLLFGATFWTIRQLQQKPVLFIVTSYFLLIILFFTIKSGWEWDVDSGYKYKTLNIKHLVYCFKSWIWVFILYVDSDLTLLIKGCILKCITFEILYKVLYKEDARTLCWKNWLLLLFLKVL